MACKEIFDGVFLIDTLAAGVPGVVASYLVKGEKSALVDVGYPSSAIILLSELQNQFSGNTWQVDYLIPTHVHLDHAGGVGELAKSMPSTKVLVNEHGAKHLIDPEKLTQSATDVFGNDAMRVFGKPIPLPGEQLAAVGEVYHLDLGAGKRLKIFWTPGHAWHHMSVLLEDERLLITGDAVGLYPEEFGFPIPATPPPGFDGDRYMKTLAGFLRVNPSGLLLPHFGPVRENVRAFLEANIEMIDRWLSRASDAVRLGESLDELFDSYIDDVLNRSGRSRTEIPENVIRSVMLSARGCYSYAQNRIARW